MSLEVVFTNKLILPQTKSLVKLLTQRYFFALCFYYPVWVVLFSAFNNLLSDVVWHFFIMAEHH